MPTITPQYLFEAELRRLIAEDIETRRTQLESTLHDEVSSAVIRGEIRALRHLDDLMQLAQSNIDKRNS